jgi:peptidoglycan/LPS O-acetylase OafA/YrhL
LFVLLSGFGLYLSYRSRPLSYPLYLKKRLSKIYIPYILVVTVSAVISLLIPIYDNSLYAFGGHVFLYKMFDESIVGSYGYPLWFISMILQFYIIFYLLVFLAEETSFRTFVVICLLLSLAWIAVVIWLDKEPQRVWNSFFLRYLWEFGLGMVRNDFRLPFRLPSWVFLIIGVVNCALYAFLALKGGSLGAMTNDIPALIGYSSIAIWIYLISIRFVNSFFILSGSVSYSLYLLHTLVLLLLIHFLDERMVAVALIPALVITYLIAIPYNSLVTRLYNRLGV